MSQSQHGFNGAASITSASAPEVAAVRTVRPHGGPFAAIAVLIGLIGGVAIGLAAQSREPIGSCDPLEAAYVRRRNRRPVIWLGSIPTRNGFAPGASGQGVAAWAAHDTSSNESVASTATPCTITLQPVPPEES
jgi:hypothetical protein